MFVTDRHTCIQTDRQTDRQTESTTKNNRLLARLGDQYKKLVCIVKRESRVILIRVYAPA